MRYEEYHFASLLQTQLRYSQQRFHALVRTRIAFRARAADPLLLLLLYLPRSLNPTRGLPQPPHRLHHRVGGVCDDCVELQPHPSHLLHEGLEGDAGGVAVGVHLVQQLLLGGEGALPSAVSAVSTVSAVSGAAQCQERLCVGVEQDGWEGDSRHLAQHGEPIQLSEVGGDSLLGQGGCVGVEAKEVALPPALQRGHAEDRAAAAEGVQYSPRHARYCL
mmetsp:Transcript_27459/g.62253  ORF Transcript_27459/g.62253 Transcript_27459/m.62253 type:complete len:219 (+) Transcript_27459:389-1045(+)